jgi:putative hydrolase of HD superfamily
MDIPVERDDGIMALSGIIGRVKHLPRTGWLRSGIVDCESVASHMYRMAVLAFMLNDGSVDRDKCIRMALVHDLAESIVGDITPYCGISDTTKHERELQVYLIIPTKSLLFVNVNNF